MPRWKRVIRGMIGTGLAFAFVGGLVSTTAALTALVFGNLHWREVLQVGGKVSVVSFIVGVVFSGVLAIVARGRTVDRLSLRYVTAVGAGGGLIYFLLISLNAYRVWTVEDAVRNLIVLLCMGGGAAAATMLLARRAGLALNAADELPELGEGMGAADLGVPIEQPTAEWVSTHDKTERPR